MMGQNKILPTCSSNEVQPVRICTKECLERKDITTKITNITNLPEELICEIASYLPYADYVPFRNTCSNTRRSLMSMDEMCDKVNAGSLQSPLKGRCESLVHAQRVDRCIRSLPPEERYALSHMRVNHETTLENCISLTMRYPPLPMGKQNDIIIIVEDFIDQLELLAATQRSDSLIRAPRYSSSYSFFAKETYPGECNHCAIYFSDIQTLSQLEEIFICAKKHGAQIALKPQVFLSFIMKQLKEFWCVTPPANVAQADVENVLKPYAALFYSGSYRFEDAP